MKVWVLDLSNQLHSMAEAELASTLDEVSARLPAGVYTTFRTYPSFRVLHLADHFKRLEESAALLGHSTHIDRARVRQALQGILADFYALEHTEARIRISLDLMQAPGTLYFAIERLHLPLALDYEQGVRAAAVAGGRENPHAKATSFIQAARQVRQSLPEAQRVNEVLMFDEQARILEGLSSNFFGVCGGAIYTAGEGVLEGITRSFVIQVIEHMGLTLEFQPIHVKEIASLDEAFLTSASRGILPVAEIDGLPIGSVCPGEITRRLSKAFELMLASELEEL